MSLTPILYVQVVIGWVAVVSLSFIFFQWLYLILWKRNNYRFVMKYLKLGKDTMTTFDKKEVDSLANEKLRCDV
jgi:hypothetical protein